MGGYTAVKNMTWSYWSKYSNEERDLEPNGPGLSACPLTH